MAICITNRSRAASIALQQLHLSLRVLGAWVSALNCAYAQHEAGTTRVAPITVTARAAPVLDVDYAEIGGFQVPLAKTAQSIAVFGQDLLTANATQTLSSLLKLDASLADNYNAPGYIESLSVRGFNLDQANNFRRNGLATSNYAPVAFENKERIEVLKGVAGLQSGVAAPGGLVNYVTKQPLRDAFARVTVSGDHFGAALLALDLNRRFGRVGARVNIATQRLENGFEHANGNRNFASAALALALNAATTLSMEIEHQRKSQPSVPGLGLLDHDGDGIAESLPALDRGLQRLNLNNQAWSLPVDSRTTHASLALTHRLSEQWKASVAVAHFASKLDDRVAFPDGCGSGANYVYPGLCGNGDVDIYDFRSENERRAMGSWRATLEGSFAALGATHRVHLSFDGRRARTSLPPTSAYNYVGINNLFAPTVLAFNALRESINSNQRERAAEIAATVHSQWLPDLDSFAGLRTARVSRASARSDGSENLSLNQTVTTPWVGLMQTLSPEMMVYASYGQGVELEIVPNRPSVFSNFGSVLPGHKSTQVEVGTKWQVRPRWLLTAAAFAIEKPYADDIADAGGVRTRIANGKRVQHRGIEFTAIGRASDALSLQSSATYLDAHYLRAVDPALRGARATNVPRFALSLFADYKIAAINGLSLNALVVAQRGKSVNPNASVTLPAAWQIDLGAHYRIRLNERTLTLRMNLENATNRLYWREAPTTSWGGIYLFASNPRKFALSAALDW